MIQSEVLVLDFFFIQIRASATRFSNQTPTEKLSVKPILFPDRESPIDNHTKY